MADKKMVGAVTVAKLNDLGKQLAEATRLRKYYADEETRIRGEIEEITARYELPIKDGKSEYLNLPGRQGALRVTRPAAPVRKILTASLLKLIRERLSFNEANEVFLDVYDLPQYCTVDDVRWREHVENETLVNSILREALEDEKAAPKPNVQMTSRKTIGYD